LKILVVDDRDRVRKLLVELLRGDGNTVKTAVDPRHALAVLSHDAFDLVITTSFVSVLDVDGRREDDPLSEVIAAARGARVVVVTPLSPVPSGETRSAGSRTEPEEVAAVFDQVRALLAI
jgi:CheY-like chemotaxis protein